MKNLAFLILAATAISGLTLAQAPKATAPKTTAPKTTAPKATALRVTAPKAAVKFLLTVTVSEPLIRKGKLNVQVIKKSFALDSKLVARSRKFGKISSVLEPKLSAIFKTLTRQGKDARFNLERGSWIARQRSAWRVNEKATRANLLSAIKAGKSSATVALEVKAPQRNVRNWIESGITTLYGRGVSSFKGSPEFRVRNIIVGASKLDNDYIAKGAELDFNASVGDINKATGFVAGFVIIGGTLEKEDGGGICQVSTTLFRVAYSSGLPITERHQHSHRVTYYDPVGLEATVYAPDKNLKFKNDSGGPLLIQTEWDEKAQTLGFYLFGRAPDRSVTISKPAISAFKPAAQPSYSADKAVRLGSSRRIDVPMQGITSLITRRVTMRDGTVKKDTLRSVYAPWGAVYAVNPRDSRLADR